MELTKKDFEQILTRKLDDQTRLFDAKLDKQTQAFDAKLDKQTKDLKVFSEDQTETLARIVSKQVVSDMEDKLNMAVRMARAEDRIKKIYGALNLSPGY